MLSVGPTLSNKVMQRMRFEFSLWPVVFFPRIPSCSASEDTGYGVQQRGGVRAISLC